MRKIRLLPVSAKSNPSFWGGDYARDKVDIKASTVPLGLITAAALIPEDHFEILPVTDLNIRPLNDEQILSADYILLSSMEVQKESHREVFERVNKLGRKVIAGGPYATSYEDAPAHHIVAGEAEITLRPFLEDLLRGNPRKRYNESDFVAKGIKPDLTKTPIPRWNLLPNINNYAYLLLQDTRGCPFGCEFCDITELNGNITRTKTPEQMERELNAIYDTGWRGQVFLTGDNFIGNPNSARALLSKIGEFQKNHKYPFTFYVQSSINLGDSEFKDIRKSMAEVGVDMTFIGLETDDNDVLKLMNKKQNVQNERRGTVWERISTIQKSGLEVMVGLIFGGDGEKRGAFDRMFKGIQETGIVTPMAGLMIALKNTKLYERLILEGRLREESHGGDTYYFGFNFIPKTELSEEELIEGHKNFLHDLFDSKNYYKRCRTLLEKRGPYRATKRDLRTSYLAVKSIVLQNFRHPDPEFFKYLGYLALHHPKDIPDAIAKTIMLYHFQTITNAKTKIYEIEKDMHASLSRLSGSLEQIKKEGKKILNRAYDEARKIPPEFERQLKPILESLEQKFAEKTKLQPT